MPFFAARHPQHLPSKCHIWAKFDRKPPPLTHYSAIIPFYAPREPSRSHSVGRVMVLGSEHMLSALMGIAGHRLAEDGVAAFQFARISSQAGYQHMRLETLPVDHICFWKE